MLRNLLTLRQISQKAIIGAPRRQIANKVKEKQKLFQEDNDVPVYLKGGLWDVVLHRFTVFLCVFVFLSSSLNVFQKSDKFPSSNFIWLVKPRTNVIAVP
ncbi:hypothetical protein JRQ81_006108 [Phrynocephalus forsythii]|uniref:Cytochrome c oxidase subunit 7A2, mitochondrial n=1 Tax=Phrynocephalus forsythii TaxID=171643 RepID=A0A9Q1B621_9SAUR|nr:hypothetical protein JRQ81_006108 [Phrynocephalus forsythii]